jgi:lysophospholipase L1-like esterase
MTQVLGGAGATSIPNFYSPAHAAIGYSDYCAVDPTSVRARFTRPTVDAFGFENANPGARVRFQTNSQLVTVRLRYNDLITAADTFNGEGQILADGVEVQTFGKAEGEFGALWVSVPFGSAVSRLIEVVMPYCAAVDFEGVEVTAGATMAAGAARTATKLGGLGDSLTHGFASTGIGKSWPTLLAANKNWQIINHGYGSRRTDAADGNAMGNLAPDVVTVLLGHNDFRDQLALATFKTRYKALVTNLRTLRPLIKIYCITPLWSDDTNTLTLEDYREQIRDGLDEINNPLNVLVEGEALATNNVSSFPDGIHPNDTGSDEIADSLIAAVTL